MRLIARGLAAVRGDEPVFADLDFSLEQGAKLVVTGPNGSGKSTLLRVVAGLLAPSAGTVTVEGADEGHLPAGYCHYLGPDNAMKPALTLDENLHFWRSFLGASKLSVGEALQEVGLDGLGHLPFAYLSTGQRRRAAIARLLVSHRPIWLLDEPTSGLDTRSQARMSELMARHAADGGIVFATTHLPLGLDNSVELRLGEHAPASALGEDR